MREIKFRAWDNNIKKMIVQDTTDRIDKVLHYLETHIKTTVMQYTGLKDRNGVEIYEGDIIEWINGGDGDFIYEIIFEDCGYYAKSSNNEKISIGGTMYSDKNINIEVIGNIYENKELLNE